MEIKVYCAGLILIVIFLITGLGFAFRGLYEACQPQPVTWNKMMYRCKYCGEEFILWSPAGSQKTPYHKYCRKSSDTVGIGEVIGFVESWQSSASEGCPPRRLE